MENSMRLPQKIKNRTNRTTCFNSQYLTEENKHTNSKIQMHLHVVCSITYNSQVWKQPKCPETHTVEYYSIVQKNEIMPFATTWIDLESIMLSEIRQVEKNKYHMISFVCNLFL